MATHDYDIANQSGAAFRTDLNNALAAIQSNNSNSSSPATTVAYQWWADTTSGTLKIRNSSNNAWVELLQLDGTLTLEDGSASTPALAFRDDLNTGIFSSAADTFDIATAGTQRLTVDSSGNVGIGTASPSSYNNIAENLVVATSSDTGITVASGTSSQGSLFFADGTSGSALVEGFIAYEHSNNALKLGSNNTERVRILSNGDIGIGTSTINRSSSGRSHIQFDYSGSDGSEGIEIRLSNSAINGNAATDNAAISYIGQDFNIVNRENGSIKFFTTNSQNMTLDGAGRLHIANTGLSATAEADDLTVGNLTGGHGITIFANSSEGGFISFGDTSTTSTGSRAGVIRYQHSDNSMRFATNGNNERLRIHDDGEISHQTTSVNLQGGGASDFMFTMRSDIGGNHNGFMCAQIASGFIGFTTKPSACHDYFAMNFLNCTPVSVGSIAVGSGGVVYNTSSDYRLKENAVSISDGITRLKQLLPKRFNWIADETNTLQDGFFAHEVSSIVPEAVTGEKDAVATENGGQYTKDEPIYQQIDHSKLVPLLVAAVKELITKVEALEAA